MTGVRPPGVSPPDETTADVVVIGAGLAGLTAAIELEAAGCRVQVVEALGRVGGRTASHHRYGQALDAGGGYVGVRHVRVRELAGRFGLALTPTAAPGANLFDLGAGPVRSDARRPAFNALAVGDALDRLDDLAAGVPPADPGAAPDAAELDRLTVAAWARREFAHPDARLLIDLLVRQMLAADPTEVSMLHLLFYLASGGGVHYLTAFSGGAQQDRFVGGAHRLAERMAAALASPVRLGSPVTDLHAEHPANGARLVSDAIRVVAPDFTVRCARVVVAVPPGPAARIGLHLPGVRRPPGPARTRGATVKLHVIYDRPFWADDGLSGWVTAGTGPLRYVVDDSAGRDGLGVLVGFVTGPDARGYGGLPGAARRTAVLDRLATWFGPAARRPLALLERDWQAEPTVEGCYAAVPEPGWWTAAGPPWPSAGRAGPATSGEPGGPVCWAGTERCAEFYGHLEGAVRSGQEAARRILAADRSSR